MPTLRKPAANAQWITALLPLLLAAACGGEDQGDRSVGNSIEKSAPPEACKAESALAMYEVFADTSWKGSSDASPKPAGGPRPIYECPKDSSVDCCFYEGKSVEWPAGELTEQIEQERELQEEFKCLTGAFSLPEVVTSAAVNGALGTDPLDAPISCKKEQSPKQAIHVRVARLTDWGAEISMSFSEPGFDASAYDGIAFWIRKGQGGTQPIGGTLFVALTDKFTKENVQQYQLALDPETGEPLMATNAKGDPTPVFATDVAGNPIPVVLANGSAANNCYDSPIDAQKCDRYGTGVGLEDEWRFVKLPFSKMRQRGYGVKSPAGRPLYEEIKTLSFYLDVGNWDFWLHKVGFYKQ